MTDYTIAAPNGGCWTDQGTDSATVGRYHDLALLAEGAAGASNSFKQARAGVLAGPPIAAASTMPGAFAVAATSGFNFSVQPGAALLERNTLSGSYIVESTALGTAATGTADPSQTRVDRVDLEHFDGALGDNSSTSLTRVHVKAGTPGAGLPAADSTPGARTLLGYWTIPAGAASLASATWTDQRKSGALRGAIRVLLPGDSLADPGYMVGEMRDTSAIATPGTIDRWNAVTSAWETQAIVGQGWYATQRLVGGWFARTSSEILSAGSATSETDLGSRATTNSIAFVLGRMYLIEMDFTAQSSQTDNSWLFTLRTGAAVGGGGSTVITGSGVADEFVDVFGGDDQSYHSSILYIPASSFSSQIWTSYKRVGGGGTLTVHGNNTSKVLVYDVGPSSSINLT